MQALVSGIWQGQPFGPVDVHLSEHFTQEEEKREVLERMGATPMPNDLWGHIMEQFSGVPPGEGNAKTIAEQAGFSALTYRRADSDDSVNIV